VFSYQRIKWAWLRRAVLVLLLLVVAYLGLSPTGRYLVRAGVAEGKILARRQPIVRLVADSATPPAIASKLRLVLDARRFAEDSLALHAKESFTTFSQLDRDTLVLVLSGAYRDRLVPKTWWFPIVGSVPYKGYFDFPGAQRAATALAADGFDVYLRPSPAFSTLGWFNDPLLSTSLRADTLDLANTVIHELTHNTFYAPGQAVFNESFANFVGARGAAQFFRSRGSGAAADQIDARWSDEKVMARFWAALYAEVDSAFRAHPSDSSARLSARDSIYARARQRLIDDLGPQLRTIGPRTLERMRLDNAALLAHRIYNTDLDVFDAIFVLRESNVRSAIACIIELAKANPKDPYAALRAWRNEQLKPSLGFSRPPSREPCLASRY
jgi:predicted aminopeptidase